MTYEEEYPADESDIRDLVERVRKHPVKKRRTSSMSKIGTSLSFSRSLTTATTAIATALNLKMVFTTNVSKKFSATNTSKS